MTTNEPDGVPPVPTPSTADAAHPAPEATPVAPPVTPDVAPSDPPTAPATSAYGPGAAQPPYGAVQSPYGTPQPAASAQPYGGSAYSSYQAGPALPKGLSITSMVTGIVGVVFGFFGWGFLPALAGVIFGHIAQRREPHAKPFWLTGLITGYVGIGLNLIWILIFGAIFLTAFAFSSY